jgi:hypothetical protein
MYKVLVTTSLVLALAALTGSVRADNATTKVAEKKDGDGAKGPAVGKIDVGGTAAEPVAVIAAPPVALTLADRILIGIGVLLLAIAVAQLTFLRSSIEKMSGERSLSNPMGGPPR